MPTFFFPVPPYPNLNGPGFNPRLNALGDAEGATTNPFLNEVFRINDQYKQQFFSQDLQRQTQLGWVPQQQIAVA